MTDPVQVLSSQLSPLRLDGEEGFAELLFALKRSAAPDQPRRSRRRQVILVGALSTALLGVGGVAVAVGGSHTGLFGSPGKTENDTSEYLDMKAADFHDVALHYTAPFDYAPGYTAEMYVGILDPRHIEANMAPADRESGETMQVTGVRERGLAWAFCSWARTSTTDPVALDHMRRLADSDLAHETNLSSNLELVDKAAHGDSGPLQRYIELNCPTPTPWPAP
jgi:hypothetical protein